MSTTANVIIAGALTDIGVLAAGQTPSSAVAADCLRRLNLMLGTWSLEPLTKPLQSREVFSLVADQGGPLNPYTIGPGGDFDTERPASQDLVGVELILGGSTTAATVSMLRPVITDNAFEAIQLKNLSNALFTDVYYNPTYSGDLGTIILWPIPNTDQNSIALYLMKPLAAFTSLSATYDLPRGLQEALEWNLAVRLFAPFGRDVMEDVVALAAKTLMVFKRSNAEFVDLPQDPAFTHDRRGGYNIQTGQGSGG